VNVKELAEDLMYELNYFMDGYYLSGNGYKVVTAIIEKIILEHLDKENKQEEVKKIKDVEGEDKQVRAFSIHYTGPGFSDSTTVIVQDEEDIRQAVANKNYRFVMNDERWSKITRVQEIPFSNVRLADLTVTELLRILGR